MFVTPDTINNIIRIYQDAERGSARVALRDVSLPEKKNLVRIINSQNNERVFFADKVVLVEGITDRLVFTSLLESCAARCKNNQAIEIVEVGGKTSFSDYRALLSSMNTRSFVVADRDYLTVVGSAPVRALFVFEPRKAWTALRKDKKSTDARAMIAHLNDAISSGETAELTRFRDYLVSRHQSLKAPLDDQEQALLRREIDALAVQGTFVLRAGEIEAYLPPGVSDVRAVVEMTTDRNWINRVADAERRVELGRIVCSILGTTAEEVESLEADLRAGRVQFPLPISVPTARLRATDRRAGPPHRVGVAPKGFLRIPQDRAQGRGRYFPRELSIPPGRRPTEYR